MHIKIAIISNSVRNMILIIKDEPKNKLQIKNYLKIIHATIAPTQVKINLRK